MSARSGLAGQFMFIPEAGYGTWLTPTKGVEVYNPQPFTRVKNTVQGAGLAGGRAMLHAGRRRTTTRDVNGAPQFDVANKGLGVLWQQLMGGTTVVPAQQGATAAYLASFPLGDNFGRSMSVQTAAAPVDGATPQAFSIPGTKVLDCEFSCDSPNAKVMATMSMDGMDIYDPTDTNAKTLVAYSYPTSMYPFVGTDVTITITPAGGAASTLAGVRKWSLKITRPQADDRYNFGNGATALEPIQNAMFDVSGSMSAEYAINAFTGSPSSLAALFAADVAFQIKIEAKAALISGTYYDTWRLTLPVCYLNGGTPTVTGPDVMIGDYPLTVLTNDSAAVPLLETISTDVTL